MMRLMGAVLVAFGAAWLGLTAAEELGRKVRRLEQLSIGLELLERELWERGSPLPQVMEALSSRTAEPARTLFARCARACTQLELEPFSDAWRRLVGGAGEAYSRGTGGPPPPGRGAGPV